MQTPLSPPERLIVAADFKPTPPNTASWVRMKVRQLADSLKGTGVYLKVNSALRACGYELIDEIHGRGLGVFADLKLFDIQETLATDGVLLKEAAPELLTVFCGTGISGMRALKAELPDTEVLGVTVLTSFSEDDTQAIFKASINDAVRRVTSLALEAEIDGLICSAHEAPMLRQYFGQLFSLNTPAIRPQWAIVPGDDQNQARVMTPAQAIRAGADRIVVGRPIVLASNPYDAAMRTIDEIAAADAPPPAA